MKSAEGIYTIEFLFLTLPLATVKNEPFDTLVATDYIVIVATGHQKMTSPFCPVSLSNLSTCLI